MIDFDNFINLGRTDDRYALLIIYRNYNNKKNFTIECIHEFKELYIQTN